MKRKALSARKTINSVVFLVLHIESAKNVQKQLFGAWLTYLVYELLQIYE